MTRPIGPNGANLTGGGTGSPDGSGKTIYTPFKSSAEAQFNVHSAVTPALMVAALSILFL
jgi:hypothetical protein